MMDDHYFAVQLPTDGEFFVKDGIVHTVIESEMTDHEDDAVGWHIWTEPVA